MQLDPGEAHPNAPCSMPVMARRLGIDDAAMQRLMAQGMPIGADGRLDPYAVVNWLTWGHLDDCPVLARRWRAWLRWFTTVGKPCRLTVRRAQECFLPGSAALRWWVPEPADAPGQRILARQWEEGEPWAGTHRLITRPAAAHHRWQAEDEIALEPCAAEPLDRAWFEELVVELAASFTYAYRRHRAGEEQTRSGTCLDLARWCGTELERRGRTWRLVSGVVAHRGLANAHFWVEVEDGSAGWIPLDPTIPAVARMLGADWRSIVPLAVGRHDARRIRIADASSALHVRPDGPELWSTAGELDADGHGALYCTDWSVGECSWSISAV
jgi:hypothetical protein